MPIISTIPRKRRDARRWALDAIVVGLIFLLASAIANTADDSEHHFFQFQNIDFCLKSVASGQFLFAPDGPDRGDAWMDLLTVIEMPNVSSLDQLAVKAMALPSEYRSFGDLIGYGGDPGHDGVPVNFQLFYETEFSDAMESAVVNLLVHKGDGLIIAYSHRTYGESAYEKHNEWQQLNTSAINDELKSIDATKLKDVQGNTTQCPS